MSGRHSPDKAVSAELPVFRLVSQAAGFSASGMRSELEPGGILTLAERTDAFLKAVDDGPRCLVGAIPFDRGQDDFLYQPASLPAAPIKAGPQGGRANGAGADGWRVEAVPSAAGYSEAVAKCLAMIDRSRDAIEPLRKVVLSRSLEIATGRPVEPRALLEQLARDSSVTAFMTPLPGGRVLVGATPELLVSRRGRRIVSHPLAGSARRSADPGLDRAAGEALERSDKNRREHKEVSDAVMDALAPYCAQLSAPDGTRLRATETMWHLGTRIVGTLKDESTPVAPLVAALHPTPAVCGMPRVPAAEAIRELEAYDRGFYAGTVGWMDGKGDGDWFVSLRCAEVDGSRMRLFSGAGVVRGSDPLAEADETSAKFLAMLTALGIDESGRPLTERAA